jgi:pyruvate,water dikinase
MDIEWALDGRENQLYIIQARPETIHSVRDYNILETYKLEKRGQVIVEGQSVGSKIGTGTANRIMDIRDIKKFKPGQVLVTDMTDPDWEPIMKIASAIVTDKGGRTCFAGETKILTNEGFLRLDEITKEKIKKGLYTLSFNRQTMQVEWKKVTNWMSRQANTININISQTGRHKDNCLRLTPDHKFIIFQNRTLIDKEISQIIQDKDFVLAADRIKTFKKKKITKELAYLWGCIYTDGSVYLTRTHGEVQFVQKETAEKALLISTVKKYFRQLFNKELSSSLKKKSSGLIRGQKVQGQATAFRCYSKKIAAQFKQWKEDLVLNLLNASLEVNYYFLAGVIDGDGTYNQAANRINIFCSDEKLLQAIVVSCLKLNILPQVTNNRNIYNVQIVDNVDKILKYTKRVKGTAGRIVNGTKLLAARQFFADIVDLVNYQGRIKPYIEKNLLLDKEKIKANILPLLPPTLKRIVKIILKADFVSLRVARAGRQSKKEKVYNITVEDNHNYLVFSSKYTPLIVNNCHAAIVSRELGIPCVVGTNTATRVIKSGQKVTVSCAEGEVGYVYNGELPFTVKKINIKKLTRPRTKIMMNVGEPDQALATSFIPNDGVGLARLEFIINNYIKIHPLALIDYAKIKDKKVKKQIDQITVGYKDKRQFFIDKLAEGVGTIAAAFYPKDVIVRLSDFKTNEYANLIGGRAYEPVESNPMIGWRGANRYYSPKFLPAFELECAALRKVRDEMGLVNLKIMIPFCRTVEEGRRVKAIMAKNGLKQGKNGLEIYVMAEIPANIILAYDFAREFDGFSIGSNDLTQLTLGIDRDASARLQVVGQSNEKNEAVKSLIRYLIQVAHETKTKVGICGQAPSDFPDFAQFLVECGIDSISLIPDTVIKTTLAVLKKEKTLRSKRRK